MNKIWQNHSGDRHKLKKQIKSQEENSLNSPLKNNRSDSLGEEILVSRSGQVKVDNLDSCLNLNDDDFIVF